MEICIDYCTKNDVKLWVNGMLVREFSEVKGGYLNIEYSTVDDCLRFYSSNWMLVEIVISTEVLYIAGEGIIAEKDMGDTLIVSLDYDDEGDTLQYDCMNLYNVETTDYVLYSSVNIICVYCRKDIDPGEDAQCGIGIYTKEKETSVFTSFEQIDKTLSVTYETGPEMLHIQYGDEQVSMYADELFYYIETIQEHQLNPLMGELDSDYLTGSLSTADCMIADGNTGKLVLGGYGLSFACNMDGCYLGATESGMFLAAKWYAGPFDMINAYAFKDDEMSDAYEYCLSFYTTDGNVINHCLMIEQVSMYRDVLTQYPIWTM